MWQLAQDSINPLDIGKQLGQAQDVQTVLGVCITVLLLAVLFLVRYYLKERKAWSDDKVDILERWANAKVKWEVERTDHQKALKVEIEKAASEKEGLLREMMDLALRLEKSLDKLATFKGGSS